MLNMKKRLLCHILACMILPLAFIACDDSPVGPAGEVFTRKAAAETYFSDQTPNPPAPDEDATEEEKERISKITASSENYIRIGGLVAVDLEAKGEMLPDTVYDTGDAGTDVFRLEVVEPQTYTIRMAEGVNVELEMERIIGSSTSTVFELSPGKSSFTGDLQAGIYEVRVTNLDEYAEGTNARKLLFLQPDQELIESDPNGILSNIPAGNLPGDHYLILKERECDGGDFHDGFFRYFVFHKGEEERLSFNNVSFRYADFSYASVNNIDFRGEYANNSYWEYAQLQNSTFSGFGLIAHSIFNYANLNGAAFDSIEGRFTSFDYCDLRRTKFNAFSLRNSSMIDCTALQMEMRNGELSNTDFTFFKGGGAVMSNVDFARSDFNSADLVGVDLSGSILDQCVLSEANLANANVAGASFCRISQTRNLKIKLAINISEAECLLDLIARMEEGDTP